MRPYHFAIAGIRAGLLTPCYSTSCSLPHQLSSTLHQVKQWMNDNKQIATAATIFINITAANIVTFLQDYPNVDYVRKAACVTAKPSVTALHEQRLNLQAPSSEIVDISEIQAAPTYLEALNLLIDKELMSLYKVYGMRQGNKGAKGIIIERAIGLESNSSSKPDTIEGEIKSYTLDSSKANPKESIAITSYDPQKPNSLIMQDIDSRTTFTKTHLYEKIKKVIFVGTEDMSKTGGAQVRHVDFVDLRHSAYAEFVKQCDADYTKLTENFTPDKRVKGAELNYLESRTKGSANSTTRAFYFKRRAIVELLTIARRLASS